MLWLHVAGLVLVFGLGGKRVARSLAREHYAREGNAKGEKRFPR
jgi:hypothetical protein